MPRPVHSTSLAAYGTEQRAEARKADILRARLALRTLAAPRGFRRTRALLGGASCRCTKTPPRWTNIAMKITAIETHVCHARMRNWILVKVLNDQSGLWGWGEATLEWHTRAVVGAVEDIAPLLIGEDPTRIEYLWQMMYRQHFWHGNGIVRGTAISGIDIALWDILGKS